MTIVARFLLVVGYLTVAVHARAADLEAVKADWRVDLARYDDVVAEFVTKASVKSGADVSMQENKLVAKKLGPNRIAYLVRQPTVVSVANEKYIFTVTEGNSGGWTLGTYGLLNDIRVDKALRELNDMARGAIAPYCVFNIPLYPNLDAFRVSSETDDVLTLVATRDLESVASTNKTRMSSTTVQLDKKNRYRLLSAACLLHVNKSQGKLTVVYNTEQQAGDSQQCTIVSTETYSSPQPELVIEAMSRCKFQFRAGLKDDDFRLTAFGLPEPIGIVWKEPPPLYVWLLASAGVFGLLALLFAHLKRRAAQRQQPEAGPV